MDLDWHNMSEKFECISDLKMKLIDSFPEYIGPTPNFHVGYIEGRGNQKRWIVRIEDLNAMYDVFCEGETIKLWCDAKEKDDRKRKNEEKVEETKSKKEKNDEIEADIRGDLEKKHSGKFTAPQYALWAKLIRNGRYNSYDEPPPIPLMTNKERSHKKESISDAIVGAATAFAHALRSPATVTPTPDPLTPTSTGTLTNTGLSPNNQANLRRKCLEDLRILSQLFNDGILLESEFLEQKQSILTSLRSMK